MGLKLNPKILAAVDDAGHFPIIAFSGIDEKYRGVLERSQGGFAVISGGFSQTSNKSRVA
jgi:hypothetical protein